jgi:diazepam-binding inhibitor (GABA receptor modulator, acyl-CoA-binding protein)
MPLKAQFDKAVFYIRNGSESNSDNKKKLNYYKYYKQATIGNVTGKQPWAVQLEARAKWDAWNSVNEMSSEEAMKKYIELLSKDNKDWENHEILKNFK